MRTFLALRRGLLVLLLALSWAWTIAGAAFCPLLPGWMRVVATLLSVVVPVWVWRRAGEKWRLASLLPLLGVATLLLLATPKTDRSWEDEQQRMPRVEVTGHHVVIHDVRDKRHSSEEQVEYYDLAFPLARLERVWFGVHLLNGSQLVAHTFLAFDVETEDGWEYFNVSIEVRREKGESFTVLGGLYRKFELMYVFASEQDILIRRAIENSDTIYFFPVKASKEKVHQLFRSIAARANRLSREPEFYNTLTNNCTNNIAAHVNRIAPRTVRTMDLRMVFPGLADQLLFDLGLLDSNLDLESARRHFRVDQRIKDNQQRVGLSVWIRQSAM